MKKISLALLFLLISAALLVSCSNKKQNSEQLVGKWIDTRTEQTYEYTQDGYYYEYVNESFTYDKTRYRVEGNKIVYYLDGVPESEYSVEFEIEDGRLLIGGVLEYRRITDYYNTDSTENTDGADVKDSSENAQ